MFSDSVTILAYLTRQAESPEILVGKNSILVQTSCKRKEEELPNLLQQVQETTGILPSELKIHGLMVTFLATQSFDPSHSRYMNKIYHFELIKERPKHWTFSSFEKSIFWEFLPLSHSNLLIPPLDHALDLLRHSYDTNVFGRDSSLKLSKKIIAYLTRGNGEEAEFLILEKLDQPEDKLQVISGTIESEEESKTSLLREIKEESGISSEELEVKEKLTTYYRYNPFTKMINKRHVFHCVLTAHRPNSWEHIVSGQDKDQGSRYKFTFVPLFSRFSLHAGLGQGLDLLQQGFKTISS
jgi:8-oxo-dGTP diphosphatase